MQSPWNSIDLVLLDRDGVLNHDSPNFILTPTQWQPIAGSLCAVASLNDLGVKVALCSNQSAVGRGLMTMTTLLQIDQTMRNALASSGAHLDATYYCPHHPNDQCRCRKPRPGLLQRAIAHFAVPPERTLFIGDRDTDVAAADAVGCRAIRLDGETTLSTVIARKR